MTRDLRAASEDCGSEKLGRIRDPHVQALNALVDKLRSNRLPDLASDAPYDVPYFDPCDGGVGARVLFLFEKPGRRASNDGGSGFISRDNNDETARSTKRFLDEAGFSREETVLWNVIPGWNGTRKITAAEKVHAQQHLGQLLSLLPLVKAVVLVGNHAQKLADNYLRHPNSSLKLFESTHPSPICRSRWIARWLAIPEEWRKAADWIHASVVDLLVEPAFHTQVRIFLRVFSESAQLEVRVRGDSFSANIPYVRATALLGDALSTIHKTEYRRPGLDGISIELIVKTDSGPSVNLTSWSPGPGSQCAHLVRDLFEEALQLPGGNQFEKAFKDAQAYFT